MSSALDVGAFRDLLGSDGVAEHPPVELDGAKLEVSLRPGDGESLGAALRRLSADRLAAVVRGGGTRLTLGNPSRYADLLLSTERLAGVDVLDGDEGVAHVAAGTPLAALRSEAARAGWELALDPPGPGSTLGGALAAAAVGPRVLGFGRPRDSVLGLELVLASGERVRCGGRVVKNVTGYDLAKLFVGSFGSLGVIEAAWIRLRPLPEHTLVLCSALSDDEEAFARGLAAARHSSARAVALVGTGCAERVDAERAASGRALLVVELAGPEAVVERDRAALADATGAEPASPEILDGVRQLQEELAPRDGLRFRIATRSSRMAATAARLARADAVLLSYPGVGLVFAGFALAGGADEIAVDRIARAVREAARVGGGSYVIEEAPVWAKTGRDVFGEPAQALPLFRNLKQRFDPAGVLNPGRFVGGI